MNANTTMTAKDEAVAALARLDAVLLPTHVVEAEIRRHDRRTNRLMFVFGAACLALALAAIA